MAIGVSRGSESDNSVKIVANIFISFIGAGVLGLPYAFKEAGILEGITILTVVAYFSVKSMIIIIECKQEILRRKALSSQSVKPKVKVSEIYLPSGSRVELKLPLLNCDEEDSDSETDMGHNQSDELLTYGDVGHYALGESGRGLIDLVVLVSQIGFCCAYLIFIMENLSQFFTSLSNFHWLLIILPPLFFITLLRHLSKLAFFSLFAQVTNLFAFSVVFWFDFEHFNAVKFHPKEFSLKGFPFFFAVSIYCYEGAGMILSLEHSLAITVRHKFPYYLISTLIGVSLLYICFGASGYLSFGPETSDIITFNLPKDKGFNFASLVTSCLCVSLFLTYPIMIFPAIQLLEARLLTSNDITKGNALRFCVVSLTGMIVIAVPNFGNLMALVGATCCTLLAFILPGILHLIIFKKRLSEKQKLFDIFIIFLGILGTVIGTWDAVSRMRLPNPVNVHTGVQAFRPSNDDKYAEVPPTTLKMAGGYCNPTIFPFKKISVELKDGISFSIVGNELVEAVQYQPTSGFPPLKKQLKEIVNHFHKPPYDAETILVSGHQDGICKVFEMMLETGRPLLMQDPTYASAIDMMRPYEPDYRPIAEDGDGVIPELLKKELEKIRIASGGDYRKMGNLLYLVPNGSNPSGVMISTERKREIYKLACEYDFIILEDDPYFFHCYMEELPVSFLSMDTDRRVVRVEGLSKIMTPGFRVAMATGPLPLIEKMEWHMQVTVGHVASISQMIIHKMLSEWGMEGFMKTVNSVRNYYHGVLKTALAAANKHLTGLVKFIVPRAGMFLWMEVEGVEDVYDMVLKRAAEKGIMIIPGTSFFASRKGSPPPKNCIRVSYGTIEADKIDQAFRILAEVIREEQKLQKSKKTNKSN
ncbi:uncharacterized protein [Hetaerina americana]|uniref:uncharacterized protein n=1 Tax=Hetaerina americana TaxID=62018 RepID=UPI003A7F1334